MTEFNPLLGKSKIKVTYADSSGQEDDSSKPLLRAKDEHTDPQVRYRPKSMSMISRTQYATAEFHTTTMTSEQSSVTMTKSSGRPSSLIETTKNSEVHVAVNQADKLFVKTLAIKTSQSKTTRVQTTATSVDSLTPIRPISNSEPLLIEDITIESPPSSSSQVITHAAESKEEIQTVIALGSPPPVEEEEDATPKVEFEATEKVSEEREIDKDVDGSSVTSSVTSSSSSSSSDESSDHQEEDKSSIQRRPTDYFSSSIIPGVPSTIDINKGIHGLEISIIGGADTLMNSIFVLSVHDQGAAAKDGRLWPGDQILFANNHDLRHASHEEALEIFRNCPAIARLVVLRDGKKSKAFLKYQRKIMVPSLKHWEVINNEKESDVYDVYKVELKKKANQSLGLCVVGRRNDPGVFVTRITPGSVAEKNNELRRGDQILSINGEDIKMADQQVAAQLVKNVRGTVHLRMGRLKSGIPDDLMETADSQQAVGVTIDPSNPPALVTPKKTSQTRFVEIEKPYNTPLGIYIAGGVGSPLGDVPIFVAYVEEINVVGKKLKCGDIISSVNGQSTDKKSHDEVVTMMNTVEDLIILMQVQDASTEIQQLTSYLNQAIRQKEEVKGAAKEKKLKRNRSRELLDTSSTSIALPCN